MLNNRPTIVSVSSPFQAMCAYEAIYYYHIDNFFFLISTNNETRDEQLKRIVDLYNIRDYYWVYTNRWQKWYELIKLYFLKRKYFQIIIGNFASPWQKMLASACAYRNSMMVFVDDGNNTMSYLAGNNCTSSSFLSRGFVNLVLNFAGIRVQDNFFTQYSDVALPHFNCVNNTFSYLHEINLHKKRSDDVFVIGTNIKVYCNKLGLLEDEYMYYLDQLMFFLRNEYKRNRIFYIPHGLDNNDTPFEICKRYDIKYLKLDSTIELYVLSLETYPLALYGYTSTALLNMKRFYKKIEVYNVCCYGEIRTPYSDEYDFFSKYFEQNGIVTIRQDKK